VASFSTIVEMGTSSRNSELNDISNDNLKFPGDGHRLSSNGGSDKAASAVNSLRRIRAILKTDTVPINERLKDKTFKPTPLRLLKDNSRCHWTWCGCIDRDELVKSCKRSSCFSTITKQKVINDNLNENGWRELTNDELEYIVLAHETGERLLIEGRGWEAVGIFENILNISPSDVLAYLKLALSILKSKCDDEEENENFLNVQSYILALLKNAMMLDSENKHLKDNIDLILKLLSRCPTIDPRLFSAEVPKSLGMESCYVSMIRWL